MFSYYLKSLHNFREQNLEVGKATSQACMELVSSGIEGQYVLSKAMLHQGVRSISDQNPDLESFWSMRFDDEEQQALILNWIDAHVEKKQSSTSFDFRCNKTARYWVECIDYRTNFQA